MDAFYLTADGAEFRIYSNPEVLQLSVKEITNSQTFDQLGNPVIGGLHDPALGPVVRNDQCATCGQSESKCPGHFGHIRLPVLCYNPVLLKTLITLLQGTCLFCQQVLLPTHITKGYVLVIALLRKGLISEAQEAIEKFIKGESATAEILGDMKEFAKKYEHVKPDQKVTSRHALTLLKKTTATILNCLRTSSRRCLHCQNKNRKIKMQNNTTVIGILTKIVQSKKVDGNKKSWEESINVEMDIKTEVEDETTPTMLEDEVEMDTHSTQQDGKIENGGIMEMQQADIDVFLKSPYVRAVLSPFISQVHLKQVWLKEKKFLKAAFPFLAQVTGLKAATDVFFLDVMPVGPSRFRPISVMKGHKYEHQQTTKLSAVISESEQLVELLEEYTNTTFKSKERDDKGSLTCGLNEADLERNLKLVTEKIYRGWVRLQTVVNTVFDSSLDKLNKDTFGGVRQILEKKEGLFRSNMMGKRVNYAARSVISPDPYIAVNQIGIPEIFASKLTYPQPVTPWNVHVLRQLVINGPDKYPGASSVINEDGSVLRLSAKDITQREAIANQLLVTDKLVSDHKIVCRHLLNGDYVLMNRQPTLHRPSIQAHKARVLRGIKTFRLHYSNCKAYNADFDGDEMNMHFPQDELARAEAATLMCTDFQYLVPKDGTPLGGLIQDHMVAGVTLTTRGRFFNKREYCSLLWGAMNDFHEKLILLPPAIIKPEPLWSGKQIISTLVLNIIPKDQVPFNLNGRTKIPEKSWISPDASLDKLTPINMKAWCSDELGESTVVFRQGELLQGVLDKAHYGPSPYGLVHCCYELYGGVTAGKLLTYLGRLFASFLRIIGFSLGVGDILVLSKADKKRRSIIKKVRSMGKQAVSKALSMGKDVEMSKSDILDGYTKAHFDKDNLKMAEIDLYMKRETDQIQDSISKCIMPRGLEKRFPQNSLQLMVQSGAKGSPVNCMQISCLLGQIELEGRRPPLMMSGRSLPCFRPYDTSPHAGGFVSGRFLTGIRPTEYFFHCMAGREGLIDTAVKTSRSGYLQRCLVKHLEGIMVNYDLTVRDSDGGVVQFYYGEDGVEATKSSYLNPSQFPFLSENLPVLQCGDESPWLSPSYSKAVKKTWKKIKKWNIKDKMSKGTRENGFHEFCNCRLSENVASEEENRTLVRTGKYFGRSELAKKQCESWFGMDEEERTQLFQVKSCPDPVMSKYLPHSQPNVLSEKFRDLVDKYCKDGLEKVNVEVDKDEFKTAINKKILQSMAHPGEGVGLVCAQSIGEPSTQMTLNTFHFAGRGEMNVTLGIPRLREILMTGALMPKTPQIDVPIRDVPNALKRAEKLRAELTTVTFNQLLEYMQVKVSSVSKQGHNYKRVQVKFKCLRHSQYRDICNLKYKTIVEYVVKRFIPIIELAIKKENKILQTSMLLSTGKLKRSAVYSRDIESGEPTRQDDEDDDEGYNEPNDGDAATVKEQQRQLDTNEYEGEEEEKKEVDVDDEDMESDEEGGEEEEVERDEEESDEEDRIAIHKKDESLEYNKLVKKAKSNNSVIDMKFDENDKRAFTVTFQYPPEELQFDIRLMFQRVVKSSIVQQIPGIKQAFVTKETENGETELHLKTDGINIPYLFKYPEILDLNRMYTNSIYHMWQTYGIEAANRAIIKEIQNVFGAYGIGVDYHHLSLLADYMTSRGQYDSFSRHGIDGIQTSPLQKVTFETSMSFLLDACANSHKDNLKSPSSQLVLGKPVTVGTGCFDVLMK